jgi:hypothetical protein
MIFCTGHLDGKSHSIDSYVGCYLLGLSEHPENDFCRNLQRARITVCHDFESHHHPSTPLTLLSPTLYSLLSSTIESKERNTIIDRTIDHYLSTPNTVPTRRDITRARQREAEAIRRMQISIGIDPDHAITPRRLVPPNYQNRTAVADAFAAAGLGGSPLAPAAALPLPRTRASSTEATATVTTNTGPNSTAARTTTPPPASTTPPPAESPLLTPTPPTPPASPTLPAPPTQPTTQAQLPQTMDEDTRNVMRASKADKTRGNYEDAISRLFRFLFDKSSDHPGIINPDLMGRMTVANDEDRTRRTKKNKPSKMRTSINDCVKDAIRGVRPEDPQTFPLDFDKLTFHVYTSFLKTFSKSVTTKRGATDDDVMLATNETEDFDDDEFDSDGEERTHFVKIRLGPGSYSTARSALAFLYSECGVSRDLSSNTKYLWRQLPIYQKGCARTSATEREALGLRTLEGKDPIPFAAYEHLARILFMSKDPEHIAVHLFLLLDWNLISRAEQVVKTHLDLVGVSNDALKFLLERARVTRKAPSMLAVSAIYLKVLVNTSDSTPSYARLLTLPSTRMTLCV